MGEGPGGCDGSVHDFDDGGVALRWGSYLEMLCCLIFFFGELSEVKERSGSR